MPASIIWNRKPLPSRRFAPLPLTAVRPRGALLQAVKAAPQHTLDDRWTRAFLLGDKPLLLQTEQEMEQVLLSDTPSDAAVLRALRRYYGAKTDARIPRYLLGQAKALRDRLTAGERLPAWQAADLSDWTSVLLWLYNLTGQKAPLELCFLLKAQAPDWMSTLHTLPGMSVKAAPDKETDAYWRVDGRTLASALKTPALQALFEGGLKNETAFSVAWEKLMRYHGAAHGLFNADPLLAGANPSRGVEPETVSAMIESLLTLCWAGEELLPFDVLDAVRCGVLPVARGFHAANQITSSTGEAAGGIAQVAQGLWMAAQDGGLLCAQYAPCEVRWRVAGQAIRLAVDTAYPYAETVQITFDQIKEAAEFPLYLRIPAWAEGASVSVCGGEAIPAAPGFFPIARTWRQGDTVLLTLPMPVRAARLYHQSVAVYRGPVAYTLQVAAGAPWNWALLPERGFKPGNENGLPVVHAYAAPVPGWAARDGRPQPPPIAPYVSHETIEKIVLHPYGKTALRIAQFPCGECDS